jgi:hypothetical protein
MRIEIETHYWYKAGTTELAPKYLLATVNYNNRRRFEWDDTKTAQENHMAAAATVAKELHGNSIDTTWHIAWESENKSFAVRGVCLKLRLENF